jgi:hypothetical protein
LSPCSDGFGVIIQQLHAFFTPNVMLGLFAVFFGWLYQLRARLTLISTDKVGKFFYSLAPLWVMDGKAHLFGYVYRVSHGFSLTQVQTRPL